MSSKLYLILVEFYTVDEPVSKNNLTMKLTGTILKLEYTHYSTDNEHLNDMMVIPLHTNATGMMIIYFML